LSLHIFSKNYRGYVSLFLIAPRNQKYTEFDKDYFLTSFTKCTLQQKYTSYQYALKKSPLLHSYVGARQEVRTPERMGSQTTDRQKRSTLSAGKKRDDPPGRKGIRAKDGSTVQ
jgi:hypothetical protein